MAENSRDIFLFWMGDNLCGLDVLRIQEVRKDFQLTPVPQAKPHIRGVMNLRGDIATVFDLPLKLGLDEVQVDVDSRIIVVKFRKGENIGLLVDRIDDVIAIPKGAIKATPSQLTQIDPTMIEGVYQRDDDLVAILDLEVVLKP